MKKLATPLTVFKSKGKENAELLNPSLAIYLKQLVNGKLPYGPGAFSTLVL